MLLPLLLAVLSGSSTPPAPIAEISALTEYRAIDLCPTVRSVGLAPKVSGVDGSPWVREVLLLPVVKQVLN